MRPIGLSLLSLAVLAFVAAPTLSGAPGAQGRHALRAAAAPRSGGVVIAAYYRPLFVPPFYDPFYDPWWYPYPFGWQAPYPYAFGRARADTASLRLQVTPRATEVYVDNYYAGLVDDYDGLFQRLHLEPGHHEVTLYLEGHRTRTQKIFLQDDGTFRIQHTMEPLAPGEPAEPRPVTASRPPAAPSRTAPAARRPVAPATPAAGPDSVRGDASFGAIALRVQPPDAEVLIDGERWDGPRADEALIVQVAPGTHQIEVRKDGYRPFNGTVDVAAALTSPLNVSLPRE